MKTTITMSQLNTLSINLKRNLDDINSVCYELESLIKTNLINISKEYREPYVQQAIRQVERRLTQIQRYKINHHDLYETKRRSLFYAEQEYQRCEKKLDSIFNAKSLKSKSFKSTLISVPSSNQVKNIISTSSIDTLQDGTFKPMKLLQSGSIQRLDNKLNTRSISSSTNVTSFARSSSGISYTTPIAMAFPGWITDIIDFFKKGNKVRKKVKKYVDLAKNIHNYGSFLADPYKARRKYLGNMIAAYTLDLELDINSSNTVTSISILDDNGDRIEITEEEARAIFNISSDDDSVFISSLLKYSEMGNTLFGNNMSVYSNSPFEDSIKLWAYTDHFGDYGDQGVIEGLCDLINNECDDPSKYVKDGKIINVDGILEDLVFKEEIGEDNARYITNMMSETMYALDNSGYNSSFNGGVMDVLEDVFEFEKGVYNIILKGF